MSCRIRRPSPALVVSFLALLVALGGTSWAALRLPKNSVGTKQLKSGAVTTKKIKNGAVTASKINTLGLTVPNARHAGRADAATNATNATIASNAANAGTAQTAAVSNAIGSVTYVKGNVVGIPGATGGSPYALSMDSTATCPAGTVVIGTGAFVGNSGTELDNLNVFASSGSSAPTNVQVQFANFSTVASTVNYAIAICAAAHVVNSTSLRAATH
jgi:hypothetical protein